MTGWPHFSNFAAPSWGHFVEAVSAHMLFFPDQILCFIVTWNSAPSSIKRATYKKVHQALNLPTLWFYFFVSVIFLFSVVARGITPLTGDKQGTFTTHHLNAPGHTKVLKGKGVQDGNGLDTSTIKSCGRNTRGEERSLLSWNVKEEAAVWHFLHFQSMALSPSVS